MVTKKQVNVMKKKVIKCVKGFDKYLKCRGFQYEIGKEYETDSIVMCMKGFHAIDETESPLTVFRYYSPCDAYGNPNRFCLVELSGETIKEGDKTVGSKIKIVKEIGIEGVIELHREWSKTHSVNDGESFRDDNYSLAGDTDDYSLAANTGTFSSATNTGYYSSAANTGDYSASVNTGAFSSSINTGDYSSASSTGDYSSAINKGNCASASNTGDESSSEVYGRESIAAVFGKGGKAKGAIGCALVLTERGDWDKDIEGYPIKNVMAVIVDGVNVKADTWYRLVDGKLKECK